MLLDVVDEMADEYMDVVYKLWESSWHDDAVKRDKKTGIFTDPKLVRPINHKGTHFKDVPGPVSRNKFHLPALCQRLTSP